jgi:hypothetical protein
MAHATRSIDAVERALDDARGEEWSLNSNGLHRMFGLEWTCGDLTVTSRDSPRSSTDSPASIEIRTPHGSCAVDWTDPNASPSEMARLTVEIARSAMAHARPGQAAAWKMAGSFERTLRQVLPYDGRHADLDVFGRHPSALASPAIDVVWSSSSKSNVLYDQSHLLETLIPARPCRIIARSRSTKARGPGGMGHAVHLVAPTFSSHLPGMDIMEALRFETSLKRRSEKGGKG